MIGGNLIVGAVEVVKVVGKNFGSYANGERKPI